MSISDERILVIDVVSDVVCPWCFIGKRRLERALAMRPAVRIKVNWRPFQLDATIPPGGVPRHLYLARKFGSDEQVADHNRRIAAAGAEEGIAFQFDRITRSPNTLDAHRVIRWAHPSGVQGRLAEILFVAYFQEGRDVGDHAVLVEAAQSVGLDGTQIRELLASDADRQTVTDEIATAVGLGVNGVPCFILGGRIGISGAQPAEVLAEAIDKALETAQ